LGNAIASIWQIGLNKNDWPFSFDGSTRIFLIALYPFVITFNGIFDSIGFITPIMIGFLPFTLMKKARNLYMFSKDIIFLSISSLIVIYLWITIFNSVFIFEVRYILFLWILLFLPLAQLLDNVIYASPLARAGTQVILIALLLFMVVRVLLVSLATYSPISQNEVSQCHDLPMCTFFDPVNRLASPGDRVLVLSAYRYYLRSDLISCSSTKNDYLKLEQAALNNSNEFWDEVQRQGYRFIIYDSFFNQYILRFQNLPDLSKSLPPNGSILYNRTFKDYNNRTITESVYQIEPHPASLTEVCEFKGNFWQVQSQ
jgi:hypothetical protein